MFDFFKKKPVLEAGKVAAPVSAPREENAVKTENEPAAAWAASPGTEEQEIRKQAEEIAAQVRSASSKSMVEIQLTDGPVSFTGSRLGGIPYLPKGGECPVDSQGRQLRLLAQIRLSELPPDSPLSELSPQGMLQFWVLDDEVYGLEEQIEDMIKNDVSRVVYYESLDESVTEEECAAKYVPWSADYETYFPFEGEFGIRFQNTRKEGISNCDFSFDPLFTGLWNQKYPQRKINSVFDLPDEAAEAVLEGADSFGHKIGGYPVFTQEDPREDSEKLQHHTVLLLQIDSGDAAGREIMWGDCGVANFFITPEDLAAKDFSCVLYTWDCC